MMSTTKRKSVKNKRDIFESTDQPHGTEDYRRKIVGHWISYQQNVPASLHEPTDLESSARPATQKSRPLPPPSKGPQHNGMYSMANEQQRMKKRTHDQKDVPKFDDLMAQPQFGNDKMDGPFFEFDMSNERKISSNNNNNNQTHYDNNRMLNDPVQFKTQHRKQKYDNKIGQDEYNTLQVHHHHHESRGHPVDVRPSNKRQKPSNPQFGIDDFDEFDDFQFNFDDGQIEKHQPQQQLARKENKRIESKNESRRNVDKSHPRDPFVDFDLFADAFEDDGKNNRRQPNPQFIYKRFKERSYAELMGTTPTWQKADIDVHKRDAAIGEGKRSDDGSLFKHPAAIVGAAQNAVEILDLHDNRDSHHHHHRRRDHREQHVKNRLVDQQYVVSHEIEKFIPKPSDDSKEFLVLRTGHNRTATATSTQPNTFYIKCNNLVIKHD